MLPLSTARPTLPGLPNYDTDRDEAAGLLVAKTGNGLGETDLTKRQLWAFAPSGGLRLDGTAALTLGVAVKDFNTTKDNQLVVALQDCNGSLGDCRLVARGDQWFRGRSGFHRVTVGLGAIDATVASGRRLVVRVQFGNESDDDGWLAYGTAGHPSALTIR